MLDVKLKLRPGHVNDNEWMKALEIRRMGWNVTRACNFRCQLCYSDSGRRAPDELTTAEAKDMILQARDMGVTRFIISGGEPFSRPDMIELLAYMANHGIDALVATNGTLLTRDMVAQLRDETLARSYQVSLDTLDRERYARFHRAPAEMLDRALRSLDYIQEAGFHTTVSARPTPMILPGIPDLLDLAHEKDWPTVTIHCALPIGRSDDAWPEDTDMISLLEPVFEHFLGMPQQWLVQMSIPWAGYHPATQALSKRIRVVLKGCNAGRESLCIDANGDVMPFSCINDAEHRVGNVRHKSIGELWERSAFGDLMRRPWDFGICKDCGYVRECGGGCRARAIAQAGRDDALDMSCPVRKSIEHERSLARA